MAEQDFSEIAKLSERYSKDPKSRIFVQLADAYRKNDMIDEALEVLNQGLQYHPQYPLAYLILGKCYFSKRMFAQAKEAIEKTIKFDPQNIVALRMLAQICESLKDDAGQLSAYKGITMIDSLDATAKEKLAILEARQQKGPVYTLTLAEEYEKQGNLAEALKVYENLFFTDPTDLVLQEKVKELKEKLLPPSTKPMPTEPPETIEIIPTTQIPQTPKTPSKEPEVKEAPVTKSVVSEVLSEEKKAPAPEILTLEDFLLEEPKVKEPPKKTAPPVEIKEAPVAKPLLNKAPPEEKKTPAPPPEVLTMEDFLLAEPKAKEPSKEIVSPPVEEPLLTEAKKVPIRETVLPPVEKPLPEKAEAAPIIKPEIIKATPVEETKKEEIAVPQPSGEKPSIAEPGAPKEEKKEEPQKPKDEDFKSFQEWLSGLLK